MKDTAPIGPFAGINNRLPDHQLGIVERGAKAGDYLRNAVNVDLTESGTLTRRKGVTMAQSGSDCHSLWSDEQGVYYADGDTLYRFPRDVVATGLPAGARVSFARLPTGECVWSDGSTINLVDKTVSAPLGIPVPNPAPIVSAAAGGSLRAGLYQVAVTTTNAAGEESGSTWPVQVSVPEDGVLQVSGMPDGMKNVYVSACNGDVLFLAVTTTASSYAFPVTPAQGPQCPTLNLRPMPAGQIVRWFNGRLLAAVGPMLAYSEPFAPALHNPARGYIPFASRIVLLEPCQTGVFVATADETFWLSGNDIDGAEVVRVLPYGAVDNAVARPENDNTVWWFSARGLVVGAQDGSVKNLQEDTVAVSPAQSGASLFREQDGNRQVISTLKGLETTVAAASSYFDAEIVRKENML